MAQISHGIKKIIFTKLYTLISFVVSDTLGSSCPVAMIIILGRGNNFADANAVKNLMKT